MKIKVDDAVSVAHDENKLKTKEGFSYLSKSVESRSLLRSRGSCGPSVCEDACEKVDEDVEENFDDHHEGGTTQLDVLLDLCCSSEGDEMEGSGDVDVGSFISCPTCGVDISNMSGELRHVHTNECLDKEQAHDQVDVSDIDHVMECPGQILDDSSCRASGEMQQVSPMSAWLQNLGLSRYEQVFTREEIDWDSLKWLTDEDLCKIGITALGPRKKIVHAISQLRTEHSEEGNIPDKVEHKENKIATNKLITDLFPGFAG